MGKILECGGAAAYPRHGSDSLLGVIDAESFTVEPPNPDKICSVASVAAHSLYERSDPYRLALPGGAIDPTRPRSSKSPHARCASAVPVSFRRPTRSSSRACAVPVTAPSRLRGRAIPSSSPSSTRISRTCATGGEDVYGAGAGYRLLFHVYGRDGVMGALEVAKEIRSHELGLVIEVVADDPETSAAILALARSAALHSTYPGRKAIAGNLAFPFSPSDLRAGDAYEWSVHHLVEVADPLELFPVELIDLTGRWPCAGVPAPTPARTARRDPYPDGLRGDGCGGHRAPSEVTSCCASSGRAGRNRR